MNGDRSTRQKTSCARASTKVSRSPCAPSGLQRYRVDAQRVLYRVHAEPVQRVVDTNGAGDGFMAGCMAAHLDGADVAAALQAGARQAARSLTRSSSTRYSSSPLENNFRARGRTHSSAAKRASFRRLSARANDRI